MTNTDSAEVRKLFELGVLYASVRAPLNAIRGEYDESHYVTVPAVIDLYCDHVKCKKVMEWDLQKSDLQSCLWLDSVTVVEYRCRHSADRVALIALAQSTASTKQVTVILVGRTPRSVSYIDETVRGALKEHDLLLFSNALDVRSEGRGIGALVYVRRVIENEMDRLLELLAQELEEIAEPEALLRVRELLGTFSFSEKAKAADAILPSSFFPGEANPFGRLHDLVSDGVHNLDDVESCEVFDEAKELFELLFEKLLRGAQHRRLYADKLTKLRSRRSKRTG